MQSGSYSKIGLCSEEYPLPEPNLQKVVEGYAAVLFPPAEESKQTQRKKTTDDPETQQNQHQQKKKNGGASAGAEVDDQSVFYNPAQVVNRDLSICAIETFSQLRKTEPRRKGGCGDDGITILEALSASGLRAIRYWKEISGVKYIVANDLDADAVECIARNCDYNGVPVTKPTIEENCVLPEGQNFAGVIPNRDDAIVLMQRLAMDEQVYPERLCRQSAKDKSVMEGVLQKEKMDVVDLDPYGTASPFLDGAFSCIKEGGLMLVTSTDSAILCGNYPDTCHAKYNSIGMKSDACHEVAVRILLASAERAANKHKKFIVPLISLHIDFYVRCFFRVYTQPAEVKLSTCKLAHMFQCTRCPGFQLLPLGRARVPRKQQKREREKKDSGSPNESTPVGTEHHVNRRERKERGPQRAQAYIETVVDGEEDDGTTPSGLSRAGYPEAPDRSKPFTVSANAVSGNVDTAACKVCGGRIAVAGPIYAAATQNVDFLEKLLETIKTKAEGKHITAVERVKGLVRAAKEELPSAPLFYVVPDVASVCKSRCPPIPQFVGALARMGYSCSQVHCHPSGLKVDAPPEVVFGVMLQYKHNDHEIQEAALALMAKDGDEQEKATKKKEKEHVVNPNAWTVVCSRYQSADFTYDSQFDFRSSNTGIVKFVPNAANWGPKRRHQGVKRAVNEE